MANDSLLFGGEYKWAADDWTASDDRVRGGKSQSYLTISDDGHTAIFHGNLDIETLGGAGFASQRTIGSNWVYDLSGFEGLDILVSKSDGKRYTMIVKDEIPEKRPDGRDESNISWEYDFGTDLLQDQEAHLVRIPWSSLKPFYRGKEVSDTHPLQKQAIKRFSIMMRSHFGQQEGDFSIALKSIAAYKSSQADTAGLHSQKTSSDARAIEVDIEKAAFIDNQARGQKQPTRHWRTAASLALVITLGAFVYLHGQGVQKTMANLFRCQHPRHT